MEDWFTNDWWETHQSIRKWENLPFLSYRITPSLLLSRPISANSYSATNLYVYNNLRMLPHQEKNVFAFFFAVSLSKIGRLCQRKAALSYLVMELEHTESRVFLGVCVCFVWVSAAREPKVSRSHKHPAFLCLWVNFERAGKSQERYCPVMFCLCTALKMTVELSKKLFHCV